MSSNQAHSCATQTKNNQLIYGEPVFLGQRESIRIPIYERPLITIPHSHIHTTIYLPPSPPVIRIPPQMKYNYPPPITLQNRSKVNSFLTNERSQSFKLNTERAKPTNAFCRQSTPMVEENNSQQRISELINQNRKIRQVNEQLKIQNVLLLQRLEQINLKQQLIARNLKGERETSQTDTDSTALNQKQYRFRRMKSYDMLKSRKLVAEYDHNYHQPCIVKCCDKCLKCVMQNKDNLKEKASIFEKEISRKNNYYQDEMLKSIKQTKSSQSRFRPYQSPQPIQRSEYVRDRRANNQNVNDLIKKLKAQNKFLKRSVKYEE